eukprot:15259003-Alexandrium_andersonii.AAC.1
MCAAPRSCGKACYVAPNPARDSRSPNTPNGPNGRSESANVGAPNLQSVSYTHLRAHETSAHL